MSATASLPVTSTTTTRTYPALIAEVERLREKLAVSVQVVEEIIRASGAQS